MQSSVVNIATIGYYLSMEIHYTWHITQIVRDIPRSHEFPTSLVAGVLKEVFSFDKKVSPTLDSMKCLNRTHDGSLGGQGDSRDPNRYIKRVKPGKICDDCLTTCMIRHTRMAKQLGLDVPVKIPS